MIQFIKQGIIIRQILSMNTICGYCAQKEEIIDKYANLIKSLRRAYQKGTKSTIKSQNSSSPKTESFDSSIKSNSSNIQPQTFNFTETPTQSFMLVEKYQKSRLSLIVICNRVKKSIMRSAFDLIKSSQQKYNRNQIELQNTQIFTKTKSLVMDLIQQTIKQGKALQLQKINPVTTLKSLYVKTFTISNINQYLKQKVQKLQFDLKESEIKFEKQTQKKRQGLQAVAQEILEKNEQIAELQHTIRQYQKIYGKTYRKINVQNVLIGDQLELKRTCFRLQNVNQKLNKDLRDTYISIQQLNLQVQMLKKQNIALKNQLNEYKEHNFDLLQQIDKTKSLAQTYTNLCQKLNQKIEKLKQKEKKGINSCRLLSKNKQNSNCNYTESLKIKQNQTDLSPLSKNFSFRQLEAQQKVESLLSFILNIHDDKYRIINQDLFSKDQINLLRSHKSSFLNNIHNQIPQNRTRSQKVIKSQSFNQSDEIFYMQSHKAQIYSSFLNALQSSKDQGFKQSSMNNKLNLIDFQIEKYKYIEKISELKKIHMHIREVLLKFLKNIEFRNLKTESLHILEVIFDLFEYSEDEKSSLIKQKKKKIWGIL